MVWSDEFEGENIDQSKWNFEIGNGNWGWGNGEHQYYRQENAFIEDGKLIIDHLSKLKKDFIIKKISKIKKNPDRIVV